MGCAQSIHAGLNTIIDDEIDSRDDCIPLPSHHCAVQGAQKLSKAMLLCHSSARSPQMPRRSASCSNCLEVEEEEVTRDAARSWLPVHNQEQPNAQSDLQKQPYISPLHSRLSEHDDPLEMKQRQSNIVRDYDLNTLHLPLNEPFLGSIYWTAASPLPTQTLGRSTSSPKLLHSSTLMSTSPEKNTVKIASAETPNVGFGLQPKELNRVVDVSIDSTQELSFSLDEAHNLSMNSISVDPNNHGGTNQRKVDLSHELLDYSMLDEDIFEEGIPQTPRRLFEEEEMVTPSKLIDYYISDRKENQSRQKNIFCATNDEIETNPSHTVFTTHSPKHRSPHLTNGCLQPNIISPAISEINQTFCQMNHPSSTTPSRSLQPSPNIATFYGHWGSCRERHVSTLPSEVEGRPIRLRITETRPTDMFSYDPYYSSGTYVITNENNTPYGNGLLIRMGTQFMTLEDGRGYTLAVIKSMYTHVPSSVVYAPKPRFVGQAPSGHRLSNLTNHASKFSNDSSELYPWALIRKEGRTMNDSCTVHLVDESISHSSTVAAANARRNSGTFVKKPNFRGSHKFEGEWNTHTLVTRNASRNGNESDEMPCCVIARDPMNVDAMDITIAPGIDPLLMICYLASHSKMDVEAIMDGF